jgi:hypothetical protein
MAIALKQKRKDFYLSLSFAVLGAVACAIASVDGGWTLAWFSASRVVKTTAEDLVVNSKNTVSKVEIYPYYKLSESETRTGIYTFSKTASTGYKMGNYSILFPDGNSILLKVTLTDYASQSNSLDLSAHSDATIYLGELDSTTHTLKKPLALTGNSLTSIVCFYSFEASDIDASGTYYSVDLSKTNNPSAAKMRFISNGAVVTDQTICSIANSTTAPTTELYFILDYDVELIEAIYSANINNDIINGGGNFGSDGSSYISYTTDFYFWINAIYS